METADRSPELHLEEIKLRSLSEPADTETSGGRPAETSAVASAETSGVKPVEDGHTPSPTSHTEATKRTPTWKLVYYGSALLIVVAVWIMALLPSVLTFSIVRSPVQVIICTNQGIIYYVNPRVGVIIVTHQATKWLLHGLKHNYQIWHICDIKQSVAIFVSLHIGAVVMQTNAICWLE